jgi:hypothetical protein
VAGAGARQRGLISLVDRPVPHLLNHCWLYLVSAERPVVRGTVSRGKHRCIKEESLGNRYLSNRASYSVSVWLKSDRSMAIHGDFGEIGLGNIDARQSGIDQTKPSPMLKTTGPSIYLSSGASLGAASEMRAPLISLPAFSLPPIWGTSLHVKRLERLDYANYRHKIAPCSDCFVRVGLD